MLLPFNPPSIPKIYLYMNLFLKYVLQATLVRCAPTVKRKKREDKAHPPLPYASFMVSSFKRTKTVHTQSSQRFKMWTNPNRWHQSMRVPTTKIAFIAAIVEIVSAQIDIIFPLITTKTIGKHSLSGLLKNKYLLKYFETEFLINTFT